MVCSKSPGWPGPVQCRMEETKGENGTATEVQFTMPLGYYSP